MTNTHSTRADTDAYLAALAGLGGRATYRHVRSAAGMGDDVLRSDMAVFDLTASGMIEDWTARNGQRGVQVTKRGKAFASLAARRVEHAKAEAKRIERAAAARAKRDAELVRFGVRRYVAAA